MDIKSELKLRITRGLNFGIEAVEKVLHPDSRIFNRYILIKSKYNDLMQYSATNTLPYDELEVGFDKLRSSLIQLIHDLSPEDIKADEEAPELQNKALPYRRENFFRLLDIHYRNLDAIYYEEQIYNSQAGRYDKDRYHGRDAIFQRYQQLGRTYRGKDHDNLDTIKKVFGEFFQHEIGVFEVYFKHIKHMGQYIKGAEVDQRFFYDTLIASLSRFELAMLFYFVISDLDPEVRAFAIESQVFNATLTHTLLNPDHLNYL